MPIIGVSKDKQIAVLNTCLRQAQEDARDARLRLSRLTEAYHTGRGDHQNELVLEQLVRAYTHLSNVYMTKMEPDTNSFDHRKIGEWLVALEDAVGYDVYENIIKRSQTLEKKGYGTKNQDLSLSDVPASRSFRPKFEFTEPNDGV